MKHPAPTTTALRYLAFLAVAALILSACSSSSSDDATTAAEGQSPTATSEATDPEGAQPSTAEPSTTDPPDAPTTPSSGQPGPTGDLAVVSAGWATDFSTRTIELDELLIGITTIPIRDRIPPIDNPQFSPAAEADWPDPEPGLLLVLDDTARFYPLAMLIVHEIVNDEINGRPLLVTYCPLCNSALVFDPVVEGQRLRFGTSGLLRNSDLVMWDDATESLWQQIGGEALVGAYAGRRLDVIPSAIVSWQDFRAGYPNGEVLTPTDRPVSSYGRNPYVGYSSRTSPYGGFFDPSDLDNRYPALERTVGVIAGEATKAYPFSEIQPAGAVNDTVGGVPLVVFWSPGISDPLDSTSTSTGQDIGIATSFDRRVEGDTLSFEPLGDGRFTDDRTGSVWTVLGQAVEGELTGTRLDPVVHTNEFWFAWSAFNSGSEVYTS